MYEVPQMKLIPQEMTMSCWYASARMLIHWQMNRCQQSFEDLVPPELDKLCRARRLADTGTNNKPLVQMAKRLGLRQEPPIVPSADTSGEIERMLQIHGPLWVNGDTHIVVIAGINGDKVKVYDPSPLNKGQIEWRTLTNWLFRGTSGNYTVVRGDSLSSIGQRHGIDWNRIYMHPNNIAFRTKRPNPNLIEPGDVIFIPKSPSDMDTSAGATVSFLYLPYRPCSF